METVAHAVDLDGLLIAAGLKQAPGSHDVVVAPNGTAATLYFAEPEGAAGRQGGAVPRRRELGRRGVRRRPARDGRAADRHADADRGQPRRRGAGQPARRARLLPDRAGPGRQRKQDRLRPAWRARPQRAAAVPDRRGRRLRARACGSSRPRWSTSRRPCCATCTWTTTTWTAAPCPAARNDGRRSGAAGVPPALAGRRPAVRRSPVRAGTAGRSVSRLPAARAHQLRRSGRASRLLPRRVRRAPQMARRARLRRHRRAVPVPARTGIEPDRDQHRHPARGLAGRRSPPGSASRCRRRSR